MCRNWTFWGKVSVCAIQIAFLLLCIHSYIIMVQWQDMLNQHCWCTMHMVHWQMWWYEHTCKHTLVCDDKCVCIARGCLCPANHLLTGVQRATPHLIFMTCGLSLTPEQNIRYASHTKCMFATLHLSICFEACQLLHTCPKMQIEYNKTIKDGGVAPQNWCKTCSIGTDRRIRKLERFEHYFNIYFNTYSLQF